MFNYLFFIFLVLGFLLRIWSGRAISIVLGLTVGVLISEAWKFLLWRFN